MYRYILCESCSQFDSLPLTTLTVQSHTLRAACRMISAARSLG